MIDRAMLFDLIYALAASDGRDRLLFGDSHDRAREAFSHSLAGNYFPELWFEMPLSGEPWFDLHTLVSAADLSADQPFVPELCGGHPEAFRWFAAQERGVRQLALGWDVGKGPVSEPAIQLLADYYDPDVSCSFLEAVGRADATVGYRALCERLPEGWYPCYTGVFPERGIPTMHVECIPARQLQSDYARDAAALERDLRQAGMTQLGDTLVPWCQELAATPYPLEFQLDVEPDGSIGARFGASLRFGASEEDLNRNMPPFDAEGAGGSLMRMVQSWGLVDDRWHALGDTAYAKRVGMGGLSALLYCFPAFIKLRWCEGQPLDAKTYLMAGVER